MKQSKLLIPTLREVPSEAETQSHQLLVRAGYIRQIANGVYAYLPLAYRVINKITQIVQQKLETLDAVEMQMPNLLPLDYWPDDACRNASAATLFSVKDQTNREYILAPTHEKAFIELVKNEVKSYKKLPMSLFQIQMKYRDKSKTKHGLIHSREFMMADIYSFHESSEGLEKSYREFEAAFRHIFSQCGLEYQVINGNVNRYNASESKEFMVAVSFGDEPFCYTENGEYAANLAVAVSEHQSKKSHASFLPLEQVVTPGAKTAKEIAVFLSDPLQQVVKSLFFFIGGQPTLLLVRGDHELNSEKVQAYFANQVIVPATEAQAHTYFQAGFGSIGPVNVSAEVAIYADLYVADLVNFVCGANEEGQQLKNVNLNRDFTVQAFADFHLVQAGEMAQNQNGPLQFAQGIEVAHIMKMPSTYSQKTNAVFLNELGEATPLLMGYYGIRMSRLLALIVEQYSTENKIKWPTSVAPFDVHIVPIDYTDDIQAQLADQVTARMQQSGYEVLVDDREERPGVKFADADLIGCPVRLTIGKKASEGVIEVLLHQSGSSIEVRQEEIVDTLAILLQTNE